jgi:hypothetical protein
MGWRLTATTLYGVSVGKNGRSGNSWKKRIFEDTADSSVAKYDDSVFHFLK